MVMVAELFITGGRKFQAAGAMVLNALDWKLIADELICNVYCTCRLNIRISCKRVTQLDDDIVEWAFQLTKSNMQLL